MKNFAILLAVSVLLLGGVVFQGAAWAHGSLEYNLPDEAPAIPIRITNDTDATLSLTITSALCYPRVILRSGESIVVHDCFRWSLIYHCVAVFYSRDRILERQHLLFLAAPEQEWVFYNLPP